MAEEDTLENKVAPTPTGKSSLEHVLDESLYAVKQLGKIATAALFPTTALVAQPDLGAQAYVFPVSASLGDATHDIKAGKKPSLNQTIKSSAIGAAFTAPLYYSFKLIHSIPLTNPLSYVAKAAVWGGILYPPIMFAHQTIDYVVQNMSFKGLGTHLKENYWKTLKTAWKTAYPLSLVNIFFVPKQFNLAAAAVIGYVFTLFSSSKGKKNTKEEQKAPQLPGPGSPQYQPDYQQRAA